MSTELSDTLAAEIRAKHEQAVALAGSAKATIADALHMAADAGQLIEQAKEIHRSALGEWLMRNVPGMSMVDAMTYTGIHKVRQSRQFLGADSRQLKLMGIIGDITPADDDDAAATNRGQRAGGDRWVKWVGHVVHHFRDIEAERPLEQWGQHERDTLAAILKPIVELYRRTGAHAAQEADIV
jgi:hypothetical protein